MLPGMHPTAVVWTSSPSPHKLAELQLVDGHVHVRGRLGLSSPTTSVTRGLPPQLLPLLPPRDPRNLQRRIVQRLMDRDGIELRGRPAIEQDWLTLLFCGRDGIGRLDVFPDDAAALLYYASPSPALPDEATLLPALVRFAQGRTASTEIDELLDVLGPVAGVPGAQPKLLLPGWLVKIDNLAYPQLLALEDLAYEFHRRAGFEVPETRYLEVEGVPVLASRRFDRKGAEPGVAAAEPVAMESLYSVWTDQERERIRCNTDGSMELAADTLQGFGVPVLEWFGRFVLALLTGNGDLHSENMSLLGAGDGVRLSPVYDPAPMRAYRGRDNHDLLSALPFAGVGGTTSSGYRPYADSGETPADLRVRLVRLGTHAGLGAADAEAEIDRLRQVAEGYAETVMAHLELALPGYRGRAPDVQGFGETLAEVRRAMGGLRLGWIKPASPRLLQ